MRRYREDVRWIGVRLGLTLLAVAVGGAAGIGVPALILL